MSATMTLAQLRLAVRQKADMVNASGVYTNAFVTDAELNSYINQSYFELYDLLVGAYGDDYYVASPFAITTDGTNYLYSLPSDFYKLMGVDLLINGSQQLYTPLKRFNFGSRESNYYSGGIPQAGIQCRVWYVPRMTELSADADICDGISGWTEYIITDAAIKCLTKEETDCQYLIMDKQMLKERIESMGSNRDQGNPQTVVDTQSQGSGWPYGVSYLAAINNLVYRLAGSKIWLQNGRIGGGPGGWI